MWILHVDMDAFFASVEQKIHSELVGQPIAVGVDPRIEANRGVVSAASYEARKYGVRSAMSNQRALDLCPNLIFSFSGFENYAIESKAIMKILASFSKQLQVVGIDEAYLGFEENSLKNILKVAQKIQTQIRKQLQLNSSIGIGSNKSIAKICSKLAKPFGICGCRKGNEQNFLAPLNIDNLWGSGPVTTKTLNDLGVHTIKQLCNFPIEILRHYLKSHADYLLNLAKGNGSTDLSPKSSTKSISKERTFTKNVTKHEDLLLQIYEICNQISLKASAVQLPPQTLSIKIRHEDFKTYTRAINLKQKATTHYLFHQTQQIILHNKKLFSSPARLIGLKISNFKNKTKASQQNLFEQQ